MKRKKEQWKPIITNHFMNGETNHDMTGVVIPEEHSFYEIGYLFNEKQAKGAQHDILNYYNNRLSINRNHNLAIHWSQIKGVVT